MTITPPCPRCHGPRSTRQLRRGGEGSRAVIVYVCQTPGCFGELHEVREYD